MKTNPNTQNTSTVETQRQLRIEKMNKLQALGHNPFTPDSKRDYTLLEIQQQFEKLKTPSEISEQFDPINNGATKITLAGRLKSKRGSGKIAFATIEDESLPSGFQFVFKKDLLPEKTRLWELNIGSNETFERIISGHKVLDIRALNPEHDGQLYSQMESGDAILFVNKNTKQNYLAKSKSITFCSNLEEAFNQGVNFTQATNLPSNYSIEDLIEYYKEKLGEEYLNKIYTNRMVIIEFEKTDLVKLSFDDFRGLFDEGDYIQASGFLDQTSTGEPSLFVTEYKILTKALRPIPEELNDIEQLYRQRYLDMRIHPEVRDLFRQKSKFWEATRKYMLDNQFMEIQMPAMEETTGGAEATPFVVHHNALDEDFYLRISSELHQKRMIVGGFEKVFDIDKNFRNEGIDDEHLQEYYQLEFYWAYADYYNLLDFTEKMMKSVIEDTFGTLKLPYLDKTAIDDEENDSKEQIIDWGKEWPRIPYYEFVEKYAGIKLDNYDTTDKLRSLAQDLGLKYEPTDSYGRLIDLIYKKTARPKCIEPVWLIDHPVSISPLAKRKPENPSLTQRMQLIAYGSELCNGFSELNDPIDQLNRFEEQQAAREGGDDEAMMLDSDFVRALEIGMPPTAGFAYSERLFSVIAQKSIRECTVFPLLKREDLNLDKRKPKTMSISVVILNHDQIPLWSKMNTIGHLTASIAARTGKSILGVDKIETKDDQEIQLSIPHGIVIKQTASQDDLKILLAKAKELDLAFGEFTTDMRDSKNQQEDIDKLVNIRYQDVEYLGIAVYGKKSNVEELTKDFQFME